MSVFDLKHATLVVQDGSGSPKSTTAKIGNGNLTFDETRVVIYDMDKGNLDTTREGDEVPVDVAFDLKWEYILSADAEPVTPFEAIKYRGAAVTNGWVTSDTADPCGPYAVNLVFTYAPACSGGSIVHANEIFTFPNFRQEKTSFDSKSASIKCTGKCNVTEITITRAVP